MLCACNPPSFTQQLMLSAVAFGRHFSAQAVTQSKRTPSAFNLFLKPEMDSVKATTPGVTHKEAFKIASGRFKAAREANTLNYRNALATVLNLEKKNMEAKMKANQAAELMKKAPSAYNIFVKLEAADLKKTDPSLKMPDVFKQVAGKWKEAKENSSDNYKEAVSMAEKAKGEKEAYKQQQLILHPPKPKRAPSAYNLFLQEEIARVKQQSPALDHKQVFKQATDNWKTSSKNPAYKK